jgi:hypothetical protein
VNESIAVENSVLVQSPLQLAQNALQVSQPHGGQCVFIPWAKQLAHSCSNCVTPEDALPSDVAFVHEYSRGIPRTIVAAIREYTGKDVADGLFSLEWGDNQDGQTNGEADVETTNCRAGGIAGVFPVPCKPCGRQHLLIVAPKVAKERSDYPSCLSSLDAVSSIAASAVGEADWLHPKEALDHPPEWSGRFAGGRPLMLFLALGYLTRLSDLVRRGEFRRYYVLCEDILRGRLRGRLKTAAYLNRWVAGRRLDFPCRWSEFTYDNWDNRLLKAGLSACERWARETPIDRRLAELRGGQTRAAFDEVSDLQPWEADFSRARLRQLSKGYRLCLPLAEQIIKGARSPAGLSGITPLWVNMDKLFERFVTAIVFDAAKHAKCSAAAQSVQQLFKSSSKPKTKSDVTVTSKSGKPCLVVDAKYKDLARLKEINDNVAPKDIVDAFLSDTDDESKDSVVKVFTSDMYQMFFYLKSRGCDRGLIVFPYWDAQNWDAQTENYCYPDSYKNCVSKKCNHLFNVSNSNISVTFLGLNLAKSIPEVFCRASSFIKEMLPSS